MALSGHTLRVALDTWQPYVHFPEAAEQDYSLISGVAFDTFKVIAQKLNVSYELVRSVDGYWGYPDENGTANGMVGMILRDEVDMALGPFIHSYERQKVIEYGATLVLDSFGIFMARPGLQSDLTNFLKPFDLYTWILLLVTAALSTGVGLVFRGVWKRHIVPPANTSSNEFHVFQSDWIMRTVSRQTIMNVTDRLSPRVLLGTWLMASLVLNSAYCGSLTSLLAVPFIRIPIDSLEDLVRSNLPFATEAGSAIESMFLVAESGTMKEAAAMMMSVDSCYYRRFDIREGDVAVICDFISMQKVMSEEFSQNATCSYYIAEERMSGGSLSFIFPKKSFYQPYFDRELRHMVGGGLVTRMLSKYSPNVTACMVEPGSEPGRERIFAYTVADLGGVFILLLAGCAFGFILLVGESVIKKNDK